MKIVITDKAVSDLESIREYIKLYNPKAAAQTVRKIVTHIRVNLSANPFMGRAYETDYRELIVPNTSYTAVYSINNEAELIYIARVLHQKREFARTTIH